MKGKKVINILTACIILLAMLASSYGLFSKGGPGRHEFKSLHNQSITIYGTGLYQNDSTAAAAQALSQDAVTLFIGIPLLLAALYFFNKGSLRGKLLLTGTIGYFLYTYVSYTFLASYNQFFLVYVALMSLSIYSFIIMMVSFDLKNIRASFDEKMPVRLIGGFLIFLAAAVFLMWTKLIIPPLLGGTYPKELEHYTTLPIQAMDLGLIVPASVLSAILIMKSRPFGYLLSSVMIIKGITLLTAITAMIIGQILLGINVGLTIIIFPILNVLVIYPLYLILKSVKENRINNVEKKIYKN